MSMTRMQWQEAEARERYRIRALHDRHGYCFSYSRSATCLVCRAIGGITLPRSNLTEA